MKNKALYVYLIIIVLVCAGFVGGMLAAGKYGNYLAGIYMLTPALAALITRLFFDPLHFKDANLRLGKAGDWLRFWLYSLGITGLYFIFYTLSGAIRWDFSGQVFLDRLAQQVAASGGNMDASLPPGMTPQMMLWLYFAGGLTVFNILPGLISGFGEEFGWRGLFFPRLYAIRPWMGFIVGGLVWFAWHVPLVLLVPSTNTLLQQLLLVPLGALGSIATFTYLAFVYVRSRSVWVAALAHITMNNASQALSYFCVIQNKLVADVATYAVMIVLVLVMYRAGSLRVFGEYFGGAQSSL